MKYVNKLSVKLFILFTSLFILVFSLLFVLEQQLFKDFKECLLQTFAQNIESGRKIISDTLTAQGEQTMKLLSEKLFYRQLAFLESSEQASAITDPETLIDFCIQSSSYQEIFDELIPLTQYGTANASVYYNGKLILVCHPKKEILGKNLFDMVKNLDEESRKKQKTETFISHWINHESGGIYYEQTATFRQPGLPENYTRKYAWQHWGKFNNIDIVVEYTTYIEEFQKSADRISELHENMKNYLNSRVAQSLTYLFIGFAVFFGLFFLISAPLFYYANMRYIFRPVHRLINGLQCFADGNFTGRISEHSSEEFSTIAGISNEMAQKLSTAMHSLETLNAELEHKVELRTAELKTANRELETEKHKSEALIAQMLPRRISAQLRAHPGSVIAEDYASVSIIFTDFKGFTSITESVTPEKIVRELNDIFGYFDSLCGKYHIEKIKTIGDSYMAAGGIPDKNETHPFDAINMALAMRDYMDERMKNPDNLPLGIRIGIHTGPVIAGVIGKTKYMYDLWGDSVNTASRMESSGVPGKVNISESTYKLVSDVFNCEYRGETEIKGKDRMKTYFVERKI